MDTDVMPTTCSSSDFVDDAACSKESLHREVALKKGFMKHGCSHYRRRCKLRAPCCGEIFDCRHCHNEAKNGYDSDPQKRHDLPRHEVKSVICSLCNTEQEVNHVCVNCGVCMGLYFCATCKFYDDDVKKEQFHCNLCGICRIGGKDNFFHCNRCGCCYALELQRNGHACVENSMHQDCPVCFEYLFDSIRDIAVMRCGHTMHLHCSHEMHAHGHYACPVCSKSLHNMGHVWAQLDLEVEATPMPDIYLQKKVWILCNDCGTTSHVKFHVLAHKCGDCGSYNTRVTKERESTKPQRQQQQQQQAQQQQAQPESGSSSSTSSDGGSTITTS
eukprot:TRINITY_DN19448_c0_g1_i1.p1 TRINITY_DN19448_c0_g1~~TRINITY_DN19448_c0_g1_i1.p1  ORF type:complete len:330 (+),score=49.32 TRINITY_DN19448_c0_g1_i1:271-1260(+)